MSELIVMLTHNDVTVPNALEVFTSCRDLPVKYWGFKDHGLEPAAMKQLVDVMMANGKTTFLEVVSYTEEVQDLALNADLIICWAPCISTVYMNM